MIESQQSISASSSVTTKALRQFAALCLVVFGSMAWVGFVRGKLVAPILFSVLAVALGPLGLIRPEAVRPVYTGWMKLVHPIGFVISQLVLALLFYGLFTPVALLFRLIGRDALSLRRDADVRTYWKPKPPASDMKSYFRKS